MPDHNVASTYDGIVVDDGRRVGKINSFSRHNKAIPKFEKIQARFLAFTSWKINLVVNSWMLAVQSILEYGEDSRNA